MLLISSVNECSLTFNAITIAAVTESYDSPDRVSGMLQMGKCNMEIFAFDLGNKLTNSELMPFRFHPFLGFGYASAIRSCFECKH